MKLIRWEKKRPQSKKIYICIHIYIQHAYIIQRKISRSKGVKKWKKKNSFSERFWLLFSVIYSCIIISRARGCDLVLYVYNVIMQLIKRKKMKLKMLEGCYQSNQLIFFVYLRLVDVTSKIRWKAQSLWCCTSTWKKNGWNIWRLITEFICYWKNCHSEKNKLNNFIKNSHI